MRLVFAILLTLLSLFYFLPFAIAFNKKRVNSGAIFALNLFLGWSLIGWVVALVWAMKDEQAL
ncbi:superinfection immunity protein [Polynucleobacter sp. JS-Polo-80-F4]|uniref:superinfection immunity protein n=1 Tax=Polynucleobacter sp. JS-Polo-80-F4 TaxID=2576918 RepID=UPI001C0E82EC|nr:superinfection immunity protein [Polynucleobacter sp. JS-Polo-80-F4]MBU3617426.1 superinfection immunity protein [Polynucleobacter sp. JS-Polo-80-F4]